MNLERLAGWTFPEVRHGYIPRDTMLYALGVGVCQDPYDPEQLRFVYERELQALPSMCCTLAHPGFWIKSPELEADWVRLVHAEQRFTLERPLPPEGEVVGNYRVSGVVDKGADKGALLYHEKTLHTADGELIGTVGSTYFLRGDGGCGDWGEPGPVLEAVPASAPNGCVDAPTHAHSALIYRLSGDYNPLHADPDIARKAGFARPILHGLCTYGVACHSLVRALCDFDASRLRGMAARFTRPVFPGDTIRTEYWLEDGGRVRFRCTALERDEIVLDRGEAILA